MSNRSILAIDDFPDRQDSKKDSWVTPHPEITPRPVITTRSESGFVGCSAFRTVVALFLLHPMLLVWW